MLQCPRKTLFCWSHCSSIKVSPFSLSWINGRMEGGMKRSNEWTIVLLLQTGHSGKFLRGQSLFKVASYTTSYLCVFISVCVCACLHACNPLGLNKVQSGWYLSPRREKKKVQTANVYRGAWGCADSTKCQKFPQVSQFRWRVSNWWLWAFAVQNAWPCKHGSDIKCMTALLF